MNKRKARAMALEGKTSIADLRRMIEGARSRDGNSVVNPAFTLHDVLNVYEAAIERRDDAEVPAAWTRNPYSLRGAMEPTGDVLLITNILRDCHIGKHP